MGTERLVVLTGSLKGKVFDILDTISIGRNPDNTIHLDDLQVSRKHAVVQRDAKGIMVKDMGSGNGTYIGNRRILEYRLSDGDVIRIGAQELRFEGIHPAVESDAGKDEKSHSGVRFESGREGRMEAANAANIYQTIFEAPQDSANEQQLRDAQKRLRAVYSANQVISSERVLSKLFARVMDQIFTLVPAHNGVILLKEKVSGDWVQEYVKTGSVDQDFIISSSIVNRAYEKGEAVLTYDAAEDSRFESGASIISQNISSAMCVPLMYQDDCLGVVYVDTRGTTNAFVSSDIELLVALAGPAAIAIRNAQYLREIEQSYEDSLIGLGRAIELRDHYTVGHTWRVTNFAMAMARELGWDEEKLKEVQMGGVLHDIGKIAVDDAILRKPGKLTDEEYAKMKVHPERGAELLQDIEHLHPLIPYCLYHHERYDGKGYPYGLAGDDIPIEGRILAVADTFDAMTSNRPYRKGLDPEIAIAEIEKCSGAQFDPLCAELLIRCYRAGKVDTILQDYFSNEVRSVACPFCTTFIRLPDTVASGDEHACHVCHRSLRIQEKNQTYFAELLPHSGIISTSRPTKLLRVD
ncbi:MAG TPA: HD domain-containing protein [Candidatus Hydrogenedentes bacterium]|nr:HD domain-containing protein [Candidatus Hydrogenedentota bacterium]